MFRVSTLTAAEGKEETEVWVLVDEVTDGVVTDCEALVDAGPVAVAVGGGLPAPMMPRRPSCET